MTESRLHYQRMNGTVPWARCGSTRDRTRLRADGDPDVDCKRCLGTAEHGDIRNHRIRVECPRCKADTWLTKGGKLFRHEHKRYRGSCPASGLSLSQATPRPLSAREGSCTSTQVPTCIFWPDYTPDSTVWVSHKSDARTDDSTRGNDGE